MTPVAIRSRVNPLVGREARPGYLSYVGSSSVPMRAAGSVLNGGSFSTNEGFQNPGGRMLLGGGMGAVSPMAFSDPNFSYSPQPDYFSELGQIRTNQANVNQANLNQFRTDLNNGVDAYAAQNGGLIDNFAAGLGRSSADYLSKSDADLASDEEERRRLRAQALKASRLGISSAVNSGMRSAKAMFSARGGGGSSYADRLAIGVRANAESDAANRMSEMERADAMAIRDARRRRDAALFDSGRSDLAAVYGDRSRLSSDVFGRRASNLSSLYGEQSRLNSNNANLERDDIFRTRLITPTSGSLLVSGGDGYYSPANPRARYGLRPRFGFGTVER